MDWIGLKDCLCDLVWVDPILLCQHIALLCFASHMISNVYLQDPLPFPPITSHICLSTHPLPHLYLPVFHPYLHHPPNHLGHHHNLRNIVISNTIIRSSSIIIISTTIPLPNSSHKAPLEKQTNKQTSKQTNKQTSKHSYTIPLPSPPFPSDTPPASPL